MVGLANLSASISTVIPLNGLAALTSSMFSGSAVSGTAHSCITIRLDVTRRNEPSRLESTAVSRMRSRVISKSDSSSPAVEMAAIWPSRFASLPDHVRYSDRSR